MNRAKKRGGTEIAFRPQTIIEARYDLDRRQNDILDILLGIVGEGDDTEENTRYEINIGDVKHLYNLQDESNAYAYLQKAVKKFEGSGFRLKEDEGTDIYYPWFSKIKYQKKRGEEGYMVKDFFKAFRENFLQSSIIWIVFFIFGCKDTTFF
mgnify:CR=1 FL=1